MFGLQEFAIVMGLRCYRPEGPPPHKRSKERKCKKKIDGLFDIARRGYKASDLLIDIEDKTILIWNKQGNTKSHPKIVHKSQQIMDQMGTSLGFTIKNKKEEDTRC